MQAYFSTIDVMDTVPISRPNLTDWLRRGLIVGHGIESGERGIARRFTFDALMQIAIAKALIDASGGMDIKTAFKAALAFSHEGVGPTPAGFVDDGWTDDEPERWAGQPYAEGETLLAAGNGTAAVIQRLPGDDAYAKAKAALGGPSGGVTGFVIIDAGEVFSRVRTALAI